jgi:hypothetical protein
LPRDDFAGLLGFVDDDVRDVPSRVLWVGATELLPGGDGWDLDDQLSFTASTTSAVPGVAELWPATSGGASSRLGDALELALARDTNRLGRVLAPMGVQYVAVPGRLAPSDETPRDTARDRVADELVSVLAEQLDLEQVRIDRGIVLYRNTAFTPLRSVAPDTGALDETSVAGMATVDLSGADAVLVDGAGARAVRGIVPAGGTVVQASTASDNWRLTVDGRVVDHRTAYGWADAYTVDLGGAAGLTYRTPLAVRALAAAQAVLWSLVLGVALRMWFGPGEPPPAPSRGGRDEEPAAEVAAASDAADVPAPGDDALSPARPPQAPGPSPAEPTSPDRVPVGPVARR